MKEVKVDIDGEKPAQEKTLKNRRPLQKWKSFPNTGSNSFKGSRSKKWTKDIDSDILHINGNPLPQIPEEEEAVGIITMEDVIEELLQVFMAFYQFYFIFQIISNGMDMNQVGLEPLLEGILMVGMETYSSLQTSLNLDAEDKVIANRSSK